MKLVEGWMNHKDGTFSADMSMLSHFKKDSGRDPKCPACKAQLNLSDFKIKRDRDNDVTDWSRTCDCGAKLTVFNESQTPMKKTFKQFINEQNTGKGLFSYRVEYKNSRTGMSMGREWHDIDLSEHELFTAKDIAKRVSQHNGPQNSEGGDVGFITEILVPHLAYPGHENTFEPQEYELASERHGVVKIDIHYDLRDPDHRANFHHHGKQAILTFMERSE